MASENRVISLFSVSSWTSVATFVMLSLESRCLWRRVEERAGAAAVLRMLRGETGFRQLIDKKGGTVLLSRLFLYIGY